MGYSKQGYDGELLPQEGWQDTPRTEIEWLIFGWSVSSRQGPHLTEQNQREDCRFL